MLIIDANNLFYKAYFVSIGNSNIRNLRNVFMGMLNKAIGSSMQTMMRTRLIWDGIGSWRFKEYQQYKGNRNQFKNNNQKKEFIEARINLINHINNNTAIRQISIPNYEADDVISFLVNNRLRKKSKEAIVIISSDKDFYQLLSTYVVIRKAGNEGNGSSLNKKWFKKTYGIEPILWPSVKAIAGDNSDNIPGVKNIGEKRALEIIKRYGDINVWIDKDFQAYGDKLDKYTSNVIKDCANVKLYFKLVNLLDDKKINLTKNIYR